jgi:hypothetical protein
MIDFSRIPLFARIWIIVATVITLVFLLACLTKGFFLVILIVLLCGLLITTLLSSLVYMILDPD